MHAESSKYVLAIDLGTSGPKAALATLGGEIIASRVGTTDVILLPGGGAEQDPDEWWRAIKEVTHALLAASPIDKEDIVAICCTTQWSGTVPVDKAGNHLMNAIIWLDSRGEPYVPRYTGGGIQFEGYNLRKLLTWIRLTGGIPDLPGKDPIAHIWYLKHERPEIYEAAYKFLEPKDYLNMRLTGKAAASVDSIAIHWLTDNRDINNIHYSEQLLDWADVPREKLPDLKSSVDILGPLKPDVANDLGLGEHVQVVMGTPDIPSAAVGSGGIRDYEPHIYIGTSSWISCHVPYKKTDVFNKIAALPSAIPGRYFLVNEQETAGGALKFLKERIFFHDDELGPEAEPAHVYRAFDSLAEKTPPGSGGIIFTPWLNGERAPVDDHTVRGGFYNLSLHHTRAHLIRAAFEGVAFNSRWLFGAVEKFAGRRFDAINIVGGGAKSDIWCQIYADVLGRTVRQMADPIQTNARGAAIIAGVGMGAATFEDMAGQVAVQAVFEPNDANRQIYDDMFKEFLNIYKNNRKMYGRLNRHE